jgi:hypothetical protein
VTDDLRQRIADAAERAVSAWDADVPGTDGQHLHEVIADAVLPLVAAERAAGRRAGQRDAAAMLRRTPFDSRDYPAALTGARLIEDRLLACAVGEARPAVSVRCPDCGHQICDGDGPCGAILGVSVVSVPRCQCTTGAPAALRARADAEDGTR